MTICTQICLLQREYYEKTVYWDEMNNGCVCAELIVSISAVVNCILLFSTIINVVYM